jgi:glutaredoxin 3
LDSKGVTYEELRVDLTPHLRDEMEKRSGSTTVPQIFIDNRYAGGFDDLSLLDLDGELDRLLGIDE